MGRFIRGDVVVIPFPYSDLTQSKRRPAVIVVSLDGDDLILCAISSQSRTDEPYAVEVKANDFDKGALKRTSYVRCDHIFTGDSTIIEYKVGTLNSKKVDEVIEQIIGMLKQDKPEG